MADDPLDGDGPADMHHLHGLDYVAQAKAGMGMSGQKNMGSYLNATNTLAGVKSREKTLSDQVDAESDKPGTDSYYQNRGGGDGMSAPRKRKR